jgi:hypothetical protein
MNGVEVIQAALGHIGQYGKGKILSAEDYALGLDALNEIIRGTASSPALIHAPTEKAFPLTVGVGAYDIGPDLTVNCQKPQSLYSGTIKDSNGFEYPLEPINVAKWYSIRLKTLQGRPNRVFLDLSDVAKATAHFWPTPMYADAASLILLIPYAPISIAANAILIPDDYRYWLTRRLACDLAPAFGVQIPPWLDRDMSVAESKLKTRNSAARLAAMSMDPGLASGGRFNIFTGGTI